MACSVRHASNTLEAFPAAASASSVLRTSNDNSRVIDFSSAEKTVCLKAGIETTYFGYAPRDHNREYNQFTVGRQFWQNSRGLLRHLESNLRLDSKAQKLGTAAQVWTSSGEVHLFETSSPCGSSRHGDRKSPWRRKTGRRAPPIMEPMNCRQPRGSAMLSMRIVPW